MRPVLVSRVAALDGTRVLLGRRSDTRLWEFPGGKVEDETVLEAGLRELLEETGLRPHGPAVWLGLAEVRHLTKDRRSADHYHLIHHPATPVTPRERAHTEWAWFDVARTPALMPSATIAADMVRLLLLEP